MKLNERAWIYSGGLTPEWQWVWSRRISDSLAQLRRISAEFSKEVAGYKDSTQGFRAGLQYILKHHGKERDRLVTHPGMDYWLSLWNKHFTQRRPLMEWQISLSLLQGFAAALAFSTGDSLTIDGLLDPDGGFHLYGTPLRIQYPKQFRFERFRLKIHNRSLNFSGPRDLNTNITLDKLENLRPSGLRLSEHVQLVRSPEILDGILMEDHAWLMLHGISVHKPAQFDSLSRAQFVKVLRETLSDIKRSSPPLYQEFSGLLRALVPLQKPARVTSVSSSYSCMRGTIYLSHSDNTLLQAETLIHEFCHQKLNQLIAVESILTPGQNEFAFYSPWRNDPRRLHGLLFGAHAFLSVAHYLTDSVFLRSAPSNILAHVQLNVATRLHQTELALRGLSLHGNFTEFGRRFLLGMWTEAGILLRAAQKFPPNLLRQAEKHCDRHQSRFAVRGTGLHKNNMPSRDAPLNLPTDKQGGRQQEIALAA